MATKPPGIPEGHKANFETLCRAAEHGRLALLHCQDCLTGADAYLVTAVGDVPGSTDKVMSPFAVMVSGDPYERYLPPAPGGGFDKSSLPAGKAWKSCDACQRRGWLHVLNSDHGKRIERCDACERFTSDEQAVDHVHELAVLAHDAMMKGAGL